MASEGLGRRMGRIRGDARKEELRRVVSEWRSSGVSQEAYCREHGVAKGTFYRWRRDVEQGGENSIVPLIEVRPPTGFGAKFDVALASGTVIGVPSGFDEADLSRLLRVISSC